ncbi:MAG: 6-phosphogluconolactonase [Acidobacteriota bacterium]
MPTLNGIGRVSIQIAESARAMGELAASSIAEEIRRKLRLQARVRIVFAAAPSQAEMLHALARAEDVDWSRVDAFHMDEYIGLERAAEQLFGEWLRREFFSHVSLGKVNLIDTSTPPERSAGEYAALLAEAPLDIVCLGIGMNGHIAFNDPPANFEETRDVYVVELDSLSRAQQVEEKLFTRIDDVPTHAITLSIPRLLRADKLFCCVPGSFKREAVAKAFLGPVDPFCPASILSQRADCAVYLDRDSASGLAPESQ